MTRKQIRDVVLIPVAAWLVLQAALLVTLTYAYLPGAPLKPVVSLAISTFKAGVIAWVFMRLDRAAPLLRLTAPVGLLWLALLFLLGFADYFTRL